MELLKQEMKQEMKQGMELLKQEMELLKQETKDKDAKLNELTNEVQGLKAQVAKPTDAAPTDAVTEERLSELLGPIATKLGDVKQATEGHENAIKSLQSTGNSRQSLVLLMQGQIANLQDHKRAQEEKLPEQEANKRKQDETNQTLLGKINRTRDRMFDGYYHGGVYFPGFKKLREFKERTEGAGTSQATSTSTQGGAYIPTAPSYSS